MLDNKEQEGK